MPRFAANLTMLFNEVDFIDRFRAAAEAGFQAVEFLFPYAHASEEIAARLRAHRLECVLHNLPAGNWEAGERGIACHPDRITEFEASVVRALHYATGLGVKQVNCLAGIVPAGVSPQAAHGTFVRNLCYAAAALKAAGIRVLIEPINSFDIPGFFLTHSQQAIDIIAETGSDNVYLQYDIYHMQRMEGELANTIKRFLPKIAHLQLADNPGRHEPGTGEINYGYLFATLDAIGYAGWIGCEYKPATTTQAGLSWMRDEELSLRLAHLATNHRRPT